MQDVAEIIASDHRKIEELFVQLENNQGDRRSLVNQVIGELTAHATAEEQAVYPAIRDMVPGGGAMADEAIAEHKAMKQTLSKLEQTQPGEREFESALTALMDEVRTHVPGEENELLPALRTVIGEDKMKDLGKIFNQIKETIPTG
jgi:hemerythrin superfamily protein